MTFQRAACWTACLLTALPALAAPVPRVTFYRNIAPIVYRECAPCHRPGESGPFPLLCYEDVKRHAQQIADATRRRFMPPWLPEHGYGEFAEERRLSDGQIRLIQDWVKQGAPAGPAAHAPAPPNFASDWQLGTPDLVLHVGKPYHLYADGPEVFWNFIVPVPITVTRWVKAIEVRPGNPRVFHHANVIIDRSGASRRLEAKAGEGFGGMDITFEEDTFDPDGHFLSWKPGSEPLVEPDGMAWRADPGMNLVLNVHMRPSGKPETIDPEIGLYFTDKPQTKYPYLIQLQHDSALDVPAGDKDFLDSDDFRLPVDVNLLAVYPHAHYLCKLMEGYATLPDGTRKWLIRIPDWDLSWQGVFRLKQPLFLPAGTVVHMRYHYDNSADNVRNPNSPPKEVKAGPRSTDEMGHLWLQVLPTSGRDQRALLEESAARQRLQTDPDDFIANYNVGDLLLSRGDGAGAIPYFQRAAKIDASSVVAATELGEALFQASRVPEAVEEFQRAVSVDPNYTDARYDLASAEAASGLWGPAAADFQQVLAARPDDEKAHQHLGEVLFLWGDDLAKAGRNQDAVASYRASLGFRPGDADLHTKLGVALASLGRFGEAQAEFQAALRLDATSAAARQGLATIEALGKKN